MLTLAGQTERKFPFVADCALEFDTCYYWCSMQYEVFTLTLIMCCSNTPQWRLYVDLRWLNIWDGYRVDPERTERTCVCLNLNMLFVSNAVWGRNLTLMRYFVVQIHYNVNGDSCIDIKWMYTTALRWIDLMQTVGTSECICAWIRRLYWRLIQYAMQS